MGAPITPELVAAVEQLYQAFAAYPPPVFIPACGCCNVGTNWAPGGFQGGTVRLAPLGNGRTLRELTDDDLRGYAWDALLTAGSIADFRHYLPRLFELTVRHEAAWDGAAITQRFEPFGGWHAWPESEREAILHCFDAWWRSSLSSLTSGQRLEDVLCTVSGAVPDLSTFLAQWLTHNPPAAANLVAFLEYEYPHLARGGLADAYWQPVGLGHVVDWVFAPATYVVFAERTDPDSRRVAQLIEELEQLSES